MALNENLVEKCQKAVFINLGDEWLRVDYFDDEEEYVWAHNEDTGEEYRLEEDDLVEARFYECKEMI